jgi:hypothetical protein
MTAQAITDDIGPLLAELAVMGAQSTASEYDSANFGDYYVDVLGPNGSFRIIRDRGQYLLDGDLERIKSLGLFKAFDSRKQFHLGALAYARTIV